MTDLAKLESELNALVRAGRLVEGVERFYAEDTNMQENDDPPTVGKPQNLERERAFVASVDLARSEFRLLAQAVGDGVTMSEWLLSMAFRDGAAATWRQVAVRRWRDGRVASERFFHRQ